jgi:hypothetical protein
VSIVKYSQPKNRRSGTSRGEVLKGERTVLTEG